MIVLHRGLLVVAGLLGASGVAAAAASSHMVDSRNLSAIAAVFLSHGPALLAVGLFGRSRSFAFSGAILALGTLIFGADLALREFLSAPLFAGAAPIGGGLMILGWLGFALSGAGLAKLKK
ncbi:DUF423 domain-containing protein [Devosia sp. MC521]|uniref:DUF423 domain-containing protein n=1 Tax=Devosia sp. MC521 TaxID=2759954 RepID=UPI0015F99FAC|nr:DUF423 domain-containing protein [Devosia sp. MC521]MBJ6986587.1 DUF423 domain-containing protein [Devosia sp. MC521]QMW61630.1 DUF423 domain-containing protein [Devosia sp. MC521]